MKSSDLPRTSETDREVEIIAAMTAALCKPAEGCMSAFEVEARRFRAAYLAMKEAEAETQEYPFREIGYKFEQDQDGNVVGNFYDTATSTQSCEHQFKTEAAFDRKMLDHKCVKCGATFSKPDFGA